LHAFFISPMRAAFPAHLILLHLITVMIYSEEYIIMKLLIMDFIRWRSNGQLFRQARLSLNVSMLTRINPSSINS
jgi:hypothetical protein